jgi:hypothetical protein
LALPVLVPVLVAEEVLVALPVLVPLDVWLLVLVALLVDVAELVLVLVLVALLVDEDVEVRLSEVETEGVTEMVGVTEGEGDTLGEQLFNWRAHPHTATASHSMGSCHHVLRPLLRSLHQAVCSGTQTRSTTDVAPNGDALALPAATTTPGVVLVSKKPDGYSSVIKPPLDSAVAAVNVSVA